MKKLRLKGMWKVSVVPQIICGRAGTWIHVCLTPKPYFKQNSGARGGERQAGRMPWPPISRGFPFVVDAMMRPFPPPAGGAASHSPRPSPSPGLALGWGETTRPRSRLLPGAAASNDCCCADWTLVQLWGPSQAQRSWRLAETLAAALPFNFSFCPFLQLSLPHEAGHKSIANKLLACREPASQGTGLWHHLMGEERTQEGSHSTL